MNTFKTTCSKCHSSLDVPNHYLNQNIKCGGCGIDFIASKNKENTTGSKSLRKKSRLAVPDRKLMIGDETSDIPPKKKWSLMSKVALVFGGLILLAFALSLFVNGFAVVAITLFIIGLFVLCDGEKNLSKNLFLTLGFFVLVCFVVAITNNSIYWYYIPVLLGIGVLMLGLLDDDEEEEIESSIKAWAISGLVTALIGVVIVYGVSSFISYRVREEKKEDKAKAERIAKYRANNEEGVSNSEWDGSVSQVKSWLKSNAKDPSSLDFIEWSEVERISSGYRVRVKYRAKNSFGALVIENKIFYMNSNGSVTRSTDY